MTAFSIHFFFCNLLISILIGAVLLIKKTAGNHLSGICQYRIWFFLPLILALPFLSFRPAGFFRRLLPLLSSIRAVLPSEPDAAAPFIAAPSPPSADWIRDFSVSVVRTHVPFAAYLPSVLWAAGMLAMTGFLIRSRIRLYRLERSALPLQNRKIRSLYETCRSQMRIRRHIPVCSTAFLQSPVIVGVFRPRIYLPIHLIADHRESDIRYMLLHELQHYKHKDAFINCLINLAAILYWFNPVIWYALTEVRTDREIACDTCVLQMLEPDEYLAYGNTLLNFARKLSRSPFSLAAGIGGSAGQIRKRILHIASWRPLTGWRRLRESLIFTAIAALIWESAAWFPVSASDTGASLPKNAIVQREDLSDFFAGQTGCFVLYDLGADTWHIYNESLAAKRVPPDSTYKIYSALFALESKTITPDASSLSWDGCFRPFSEWNRDQTLASAMHHSVNWYFQELDQRAGIDALKEFYRTIGYGNQDLSGGISEFWMESSLKISALEQVQLLKKFYTNEWGLEDEHVQTVKEALRLSDPEHSGLDGAVLSGKTGTGIVNGQSVNGWFIGYAESHGNTWFFALNLQGNDHADGLTAGEITRKILADRQIL